MFNKGETRKSFTSILSTGYGSFLLNFSLGADYYLNPEIKKSRPGRDFFVPEAPKKRKPGL